MQKGARVANANQETLHRKFLSKSEAADFDPMKEKLTPE